MSWNLDYTALYARRARFAIKMSQDREALSQLLAFYSNNPIEWIEDWCITYDPRAVEPLPKIMPFILFDRQKDFVNFLMRCLEDKESGLAEKARDMGLTWLCAAFSTWLWLFRPGSAIGWGSRKAELVDKIGDPSSIFEKIRMILRYLPGFMMPRKFVMNLHANHMRIINPANGSVMTGETGDNIGRGGRTTIYFKDESAHYERPEQIEAALGDNTDVQIDISSVHGTANVFYRRRMAGEIWEPGKVMEKGTTRIFIFDWRDNPLKTQEWYDNRRKKAEAEGLLHIFAQEVDRDYSSSIERVIIEAQWVKAAIDAHIILNFDDKGEKTAGQDVADGGGDKNALAIRHGVILKYVQHWGGDAGDAAAISLVPCIEHQVKELYYDSVGVGSGYKTGMNNLNKQQRLPRGLRVMPWNGGGKVLEPARHIIPDDLQSPKNEDFFHNLKAQGWWKLRARFYKTYRAVNHGEKYDPAELISLPKTLPRLQELVMELSQPIRKEKDNGKLMVDKKPEGSSSPNLADAVMMCYCPTRKISILEVLG